jgi:hypothetical protein
MNVNETERWIQSIPTIAEPSDEQADALRGLFGSAGLTTFLGLLKGARQGRYAFLSNVPLGGAENDCAAAVIQGTIRGLEIAFDTVREVAVPMDADEGD